MERALGDVQSKRPSLSPQGGIMVAQGASPG